MGNTERYTTHRKFQFIAGLQHTHNIIRKYPGTLTSWHHSHF